MDKEEKGYLSVTETNTLVKSVLEGTMAYSLRVRGEISSFKKYPTAAYFSIKDEKSVLDCIMWDSSLRSLSFQPKVGDLVDLVGRINVYVARGKYNFVAYGMNPSGQGDALLRLEELKRKLASEGLFDETRKRPIEPYPSEIGIICARGSAALSDLIKNISMRWQYADILFFPSLVQGEEAPKELLKAFEKSQEYDLDTLIIARGGGSNEDLSAFNDESLARAVSRSKMPTISAVGHEVDVTLIDYVSDLRVSTPTGAAVASTPNQDDLLSFLVDSDMRISVALGKRISRDEERVRLLSSRSFFLNPGEIYSPLLEKIGNLDKRLSLSLDGCLSKNEEKIKSLSSHLKAISPYEVISRGYSIIEGESGEILKSAKEVKAGQKLKTIMKDGIIISVAEEIKDER